MSVPLLRHPAGKFLLRHYVELLLGCAVLFVLQTGLVPFDFFQIRPGAPQQEFFGTATSRYTFPDILSNIFMYMPIGIFLYWSLYRAMRRRGRAALLTLAASAALSIGIEWLQMYSPSRVSSLIDLFSNILGAGLGILLSSLAQFIVPRLVGAALCEFHERPHVALLKTFCGLLVFAAAVPFSFSFDAGLLKQSVKATTVVPFGNISALEAAADTAHKVGNNHAYALFRWRNLKQWSRWVAEAASFAILVWLMQPVLRGYYRFNRSGTLAMTLWLCGGLAIVLSVIQIPLVTRAADVTDILFRWLGMIVGLVARASYDSPRSIRARGAGTDRWHRVVPVGCALTFGYICYTGVIPLTFAADTGGLTGAIQAQAFLPFFGYFVTRFDLMIDDVMEKFAVYALFAGLLATCWSRLHGKTTFERTATLASIGVVIATVLEVVQAYIPVRITSLTDLILAAAGCTAGTLAQEHAVKFYRFALTRELPLAEPARPVPELVPGLTPTDVLIGTLTEPSPNAPTEPTLEPRPKPTEQP